MKICTNFIDRVKGLMFKKEITDEYLFPRCKSVHTFFMKTNIDIIAINKDGKIIKIYKNITPNKIILTPKETYSVLETKINSKYKKDDLITQAIFIKQKNHK